MAKKDYESRTEAMLMPIVEAKGFELVDVEWGERKVPTGICVPILTRRTGLQ